MSHDVVHAEDRIKQTAVSAKLPLSLTRELQAYCEVEGRAYQALKQYFIEIAIFFGRSEQRFRLAPRHFILDEPHGETEKVYLSPEDKEWFEAYAQAESLSVSELVCQFLVFVAEYHRQLVKPGRVLRKEGFIARIAEDLSRRWAKTL